MTLEAAAMPVENLENITEAQMAAFAVEFNAIEPGGIEPVYNNGLLNLEFVQMIDFMDVISVFSIAAAVIYISLPFLRKLSRQFAFIRS